MATSFAYSPTSASDLSEAQLRELNMELLQELRRLTPGRMPSTGSLDLRTQTGIRLILNALKRIRAGIYGACLVCRSPIPYQRLAIIPETRTCVRCRWDRAAG